MNDVTVLDFCEGGAKDGIQKYNQDLHVSASRELTNDNERQRTPTDDREQLATRSFGSLSAAGLRVPQRSRLL
jgi:hypothetical protein